MLSEENVKQIATLARIHLGQEDFQFLQKDLEKILDYINKLESLSVSDIEPTSHVLPLKNIYRPDQIKPSLSQAEALNFAVESKQGFFKVPKVIE